jgi:uncharacterized protein YndB with AHSA1/START domain
MAYDFKLCCDLPAPPQAVYDAWLDSTAHSPMTGSTAEIGKHVGDRYTAWDGYISGKTLELAPGRRIAQSWRTTEFDPRDPDSTIVVDLEPTRTGTQLTLTHRGVPDGQTGYEYGGWQNFYFAPMQAYFESEKKKSGAKSRAKPRPKPKP